MATDPRAEYLRRKAEYDESGRRPVQGLHGGGIKGRAGNRGLGPQGAAESGGGGGLAGALGSAGSVIGDGSGAAIDEAQTMLGVVMPVVGAANNPIVDVAQGQGPLHTYTGTSQEAPAPYETAYDPRTQTTPDEAGPGQDLRARQNQLAQLSGLLAMQAGGAQPRDVPTATAAQIDRGRIDAAGRADLTGRNYQNLALQQQARAAAGEVPSAAAIGQDRALAQNVAAQIGAQTAAAGSSMAHRAGLLAGQGASQAGQDALRRQTAARAQEQAQARGSFGDTIAAMWAAEQARATLEGRIATTDAGYRADVNNFNADQTLRGRTLDDDRRAGIARDALTTAGRVSASELDTLRRDHRKDANQVRRDTVIEALRSGADLQETLALLSAISGGGAMAGSILADRSKSGSGEGNG